MKERISVIIPTLNEEENIGFCLGCLLEQSEKPFEVIVVDNGSKDKTLEIEKSFNSKFKKSGVILKIFYYPYGNQINAREFAVKKSSGTIIGSLDADALPNKQWILKIKEYFKDKEIVGIGGKSRFRNKSFIFNFFYLVHYYITWNINLYCIGGGNSAFRKSTFVAIDGYNGLDQLRKKENINYVKDDYFLSKKLERKGRVKFCADLNVSLLYRFRNKKSGYKDLYSFKEVIKKIILNIFYNYKITKALKKSSDRFKR